MDGRADDNFWRYWAGTGATNNLSLSLVFDRYVRSEYFEDNPSRSIAIGRSSTGPVSPGFFFEILSVASRKLAYNIVAFGVVDLRPASL